MATLYEFTTRMDGSRVLVGYLHKYPATIPCKKLHPGGHGRVVVVQMMGRRGRGAPRRRRMVGESADDGSLFALA